MDEEEDNSNVYILRELQRELQGQYNLLDSIDKSLAKQRKSQVKGTTSGGNTSFKASFSNNRQQQNMSISGSYLGGKVEGLFESN